MGTITRSSESADTAQIERMPCPSRRVFEREIAPRNQPVVFTGGIDGWGARDWTFESVANRCGDVLVRLEQGDLFACTGVSEEGNIVSKRRVEVPLSEFARYLATEPPVGQPVVYLTEWEILDYLPEFAAEIDYARPGLFRREYASPVKVYMGPAGAFTPLHYDHAPNLTAQIRGRKRWVFYSPDQTQWMYTYPAGAQLAHFSRANSRERMQDYAAFPLLANTHAVEAIVDEGDLLYVPTGWWHHVTALSSTFSLNFFWKPFPLLVRQLFELPGRRKRKQRRASDVRIDGQVMKVMLRDFLSLGLGS